VRQTDRRRQAFETASLVICDLQALVVLRFGHMDLYFVKLGETVNEIRTSERLNKAPVTRSSDFLW
jgi:hypothetical protein